jgi:predicted nucleic-acid-binding protein
MVAVDTNVIVRLLTGDDRRQYAAARRLFATESVWVAKTVLLETVWVLASLYGFDWRAIHSALVGLLGLSNVEVEDDAAVASALLLMSQGVEFAHALHVASKPANAAFATFDRALVRRAVKAGATEIVTL